VEVGEEPVDGGALLDPEAVAVGVDDRVGRGATAVGDPDDLLAGAPVPVGVGAARGQDTGLQAPESVERERGRRARRRGDPGQAVGAPRKSGVAAAKASRPLNAESATSQAEHPRGRL
jgi:hypothetical protein